MRRRDFLSVSGLTVFELFISGCRRGLRAQTPSHHASATPRQAFGPLVERDGALLALPSGFDYRIIQRAGDRLHDGHHAPCQPDGMACFPTKDGQWVLLRNHELGDKAWLDKRSLHWHAASGRKPSESYRDDVFGGVSRVVLDPQTLQQDFERSNGTCTAITHSNMVLAGTQYNCSGGALPEGWVSCEESSRPGHGYAFLTRPQDKTLTAPRRLDSWGRFVREAVALDPRTGIVYMTEDATNACFYRHVPATPGAPMGAGELQALCIDGLDHSDPYPKPMEEQAPAGRWSLPKRWSARWVNVPDRHATQEPCRNQASQRGATRFNRSEGIIWERDAAWFIASTAGPLKAGQLFEYRPNRKDESKGELVLHYEVRDRGVLSCPDNLASSPWGDILLAEDNYRASKRATSQYIRGMRPDGTIYDLARNRHNFPGEKRPGGEFTGLCFSPDGKVLFVNIQHPEHVTLAIRGPWLEGPAR